MDEIREYLERVQDGKVIVVPPSDRIVSFDNDYLERTWRELMRNNELKYKLGYVAGLKKAIKLIKEKRGGTDEGGG